MRETLKALGAGDSPAKIGTVERVPDSWRKALRQLIGADGMPLWKNLLEIANGKAWVAVTADGKMSEPQIPSTADRVAANVYLSNMGFGKPVDQTKVMAAERAANQLSEVTEMSTYELEVEAKKLLIETGVINPSQVVNVAFKVGEKK